MARQIKIEDVGASRLRVLLRDARIDPTRLTDVEVISVYRRRFGDTCTINSDELRD